MLVLIQKHILHLVLIYCGFICYNQLLEKYSLVGNIFYTNYKTECNCYPLNFRHLTVHEIIITTKGTETAY